MQLGPRGPSCDNDPPIVSFLLPARPETAGELMRNFTPFTHFFAHEASAMRWVKEYPGTFLLRFEDAWRLARLRNGPRYRGRWESSFAP